MNALEELYKNDIAHGIYYSTDIKVRWEEMDLNGHINYAAYLDYYSEARIEAIGHDLLDGLRKEGIGPVVYKAEVDFNKELFHPDTAHIVTWLDEVISKTRVAITQRIYSSNKKIMISNARFYAVFMDLKKRKPVRIPEVIKSKFLHGS